MWYLGEEVTNYTYWKKGKKAGKVKSTDHAGAWETGKDVAGKGSLAQPGFIMLAAPKPGAPYHQEYYPGEAEDTGKVVAVDVPVTLGDGSQYTCTKILDSSTLTPKAKAFKYYAPGVGVVLEEEDDERVELAGTFFRAAAGVPDFNLAVFSAPADVDNALFPLVPETTRLLIGETEDGVEAIVTEVLDGTHTVLGVDCRVIRDRAFLDGLLIEEAHDWFAQDDAGNVWYMGETVDVYEYDDDDNLLEITHEGAWEAGMDVAGTGSIALAGYQMPAASLVGETYSQEFYADEAEDQAHTIRLDASLELADGTHRDGLLQTVEWSPVEPWALGYKFYAPGEGLLRDSGVTSDESLDFVGAFATAEDTVPDFGAATFSDPTMIDHPHLPLAVGATFTYEGETEDGLETILVEVLPDAKSVLGVPVVVVRDRASLDGLLVEDTYDWFAQDDAGNVWYMGEHVDNYHYDEFGALIDITHEGSWEAGLDVAGVGAPAKAGHLLPAAPSTGASFYQEFYPEEAEDLAYVSAVGVTAELPGGASYPDCVRLLEWNRFSPGDAHEYKYFAPGVGLVLIESLTDDEVVELVGTTP